MKAIMKSKPNAVVVILLVLVCMATSAKFLALRTAAGQDARESAPEKPLKRETVDQQPPLEKTKNDAPTARNDEDQPTGKKIALLIGVNHYNKSISLNSAEQDVVELGKVLKAGGYEVTLLCDREGRKDAAKKPILANIQTQLKAALDRCQDRHDTILVAFAGHGYQVGDEPFICPADSNPDSKTTDTDLSVCQRVCISKVIVAQDTVARLQ